MRVGALVLLAALLSGAGGQRFGEYEVKMSFVFNFGRFMEWPERGFSSSESPFEICLFGADPFGESFDRKLRGRRLQNRKIRLSRVDDAGDLGSCHLVFVADGSREGIADVLRRFGSQPILFISDREGSVEDGAMISFAIVERRVRFDVNLSAIRAAGLRPSSQLLQLARSLRYPPEDPTP